MILSFKKQFVSKILNGTKKHTIRKDKNKRWNTGRLIHFATGLRSKHYNQFANGYCKKVDKFEIIYTHVFYTNFIKSIIFINDHKPFIVLINNKPLNIDEVKTLAKNDGFDSIEGFLLWFDQDFQGRLIHWNLFKMIKL